jgi:uncharacterized protein (TIGR03437 family)
VPFVDGDVALATVSSVVTATLSASIPRFNDVLPLHVGPPLKIETLSLTSGVVGVNYSQSIVASGGVPPYTFSLAAGVLPPGLQLVPSKGDLTGIPTTSGTYNFSIRVLDALQTGVTQAYAVTILVPGTPFQPSFSKLDFTAIQNGAAPPQQVVSLVPVQGALTFRVTVDGGAPNLPAPSWILVTPDSGPVPVLLNVTVNQGALPPGSYNARILVQQTDVQGLPPLVIPVVLTVGQPPPPELKAAPSLLRFNIRQATPGKKFAFIQLRNAGGGSSIPFTATVVRRSSWISGLFPVAGLAGSTLPASVRVTVDSNGLAPGIYRDSIRFAWAGGVVEIPVVLRVVPSGPILSLNKRGVRFSMQKGVPIAQFRTVQIANIEPLSTMVWSAELIRGSDWFGLLTTSGNATLGSPSDLTIGLKLAAANLAAGNYYGLIRVTATAAPNSPQYVMVVLEVRAAGQPAVVELDPGGLVLTTQLGSQLFVRGTATLTTTNQTPVAFQAAAFSDGEWLTVSPASGTVSAAANAALTVSVKAGGEALGIHFGEVTVAIGAGVRSLVVAMIVTAPGQAAPIRAATCAPDKATVASTGIGNNFSVPAGWPSALSVQVRDSCGTAISNATVVASFSNGDPPLSLDSDDAVAGVYAATWQPGAVSPQMNVTISAFTSEYAEAKMVLAGGVQQNAAPTLDEGGIAHPYDPYGGLLTVGMPVSVYGHGLSSAGFATTVPLPTSFNNTSVLIGPYEAPLYYVSDRLVNVQFPVELLPGHTYPVVVIANGAITIPEPADVVGVSPGMASFLEGPLIAQKALEGYQLVDAGHPAKRGDFLVMYLIGLGATNHPVPNGQPTPFSPLSLPTTPVTLTLNGAPVNVDFVGLTPTAVGLFQLNFQVPADAPLNTPLEVVVTQGGKTSNVATLTVVP